MKRSYASGSEKRKAAIEKKKKEDELIAKIPKLSSLFGSKNQTAIETSPNEPSTSGVESTFSQCAPSSSGEQYLQLENSFTDLEIQSPKEDASIQNKSAPSTDPALWDIETDINYLQSYWAKHGECFFHSFKISMNAVILILPLAIILLGPEKCQNFNVDFKSLAKQQQQKRHFSLSYLDRKLANGDIVKRDWVVFSPTLEAVFCFPCKLFGDKKQQLEGFRSDGFKNWKNCSRDFKTHENTEHHIRNCVAYKTRHKGVGTIDTANLRQHEIDLKYWREVLLRVASVIKFLASRGLAFRGNEHKFGSQHNGNYLGILELLAEFDPFLANHIQRYGNIGKGMKISLEHPTLESKITQFINIILISIDIGRASYLSSNTCDEFIEIIGKKVFAVILSELYSARYYSISVDSTPDISHIDQLAFCIRYIKDEAAVERFLQFIPVQEHKSEYLCDIVLTFLRTYGIDIMNCRGQSYDNANNMAGIYGGLQKRILDVNSLALFFPCAAHSLCLIGKNSAAKNSKAADFFNFLENLYLFFARAPARWEKLLTALSTDELVLKRTTGTRWSAKHKAVKALCTSYVKVVEVLVYFLSEESSLSDEHKSTARGLLKKLIKFQTLFLLFFWEKILSKFDKISQAIQKSNIDLSVTVKLFESLKKYLEDLETDFDSIFDSCKDYFMKNIESNAKLCSFLHDEGRTRSERRGSSDSPDALRTGIFVPILKSLLDELGTRSKVYSDLNKNFNFLVKLKDMNNDDILNACVNVANLYKNDISGGELTNECQMAKFYFTSEGDSNEISHSSMYATIVKDKLSTTFPNMETLLRIYLSLFVTNVVDERSFSKLKYIKNYLRNSMTESKLNDLSLICIERNVLETINFEEIIDTFLNTKHRRFLEHTSE
jgi:hypothetical protein